MEFPENTNRSRKPVPEKKKIEKVTSNDVVRRKTPLGKRFKETFGGGDARSVWSYVALDVLLPAAKDMVVDAFSTGIERMVFGEVRSSGRRGSRSGYGRNGYVSYNNRYAQGSGGGNPFRDDGRRDISRASRSSHDFDEIILQTRVEAEQVIENLFELVSQYEQATVSDLYELVGVSANYTDDKWGWTDIRGAGVTRVRSGYLLDLPKPEPLRD